MEIKNLYKYKTPDLCKLLGVTRMTLYLWEKEGRLVTPRNRKGDRVFTMVQMKQILREFSPGGKNEWKFQPSSE